MATITDKRLCAGTLTDSNATLYTAPSGAGDITIVKAITLCNKTGSTAAVTIKLDGVEIISGYSIVAYDSITIPFIDQIIEASEIIEGFSDTASAINYYISGKEVVA